MQTHVKVLGILHIVFGGIGLLVALGIMALFGSIAGLVGISADRDAAVAAPIIGMVGTLIMVLIIVLSVPGIIIGWGILNFRPWARIWDRPLGLRADSRPARDRSGYLRALGAAIERRHCFVFGATPPSASAGLAASAAATMGPAESSGPAESYMK